MHDDPPPPPFTRRYPAAAIAAVRTLRRLRTPQLGRYVPRSTLELPQHPIMRASTPAIDFHAHIGRWLCPTGGWMQPDVGLLLEQMSELNVSGIVNLDGRWGTELEQNLDRYDRAHPERFFTFCHLDWRLLDHRDGPDRLVSALQRSLAAGARGVKVWKDLGLRVTARGRPVLPDDPLLDNVWEAVADAGVPVLIHVADPVAFFDPPDRTNERLEEMRRNPRGAQHGGGRARFLRLIDALEHMVAAHPRTAFVSAHGCYPENLQRVDELLGRYPNLHIDIAAVVQTLGRQPRGSRSLILRHPDQVLFGTDIFPVRPGMHRTCFRFLETGDEEFEYSDEPVPPSGRWRIAGLELPKTVLEKVYRTNGERLLGLRPVIARSQAATAPLTERTESGVGDGVSGPGLPVERFRQPVGPSLEPVGGRSEWEGSSSKSSALLRPGDRLS